MPIKVAEGLPVSKKLIDEGVKVIFEKRAATQNIRPLRILILNLMPKKQETELQLLRLIGGTALQIDVDLLHTSSYESQNVSPQHLDKFYKTFAEIKDSYYDGFIITGAPVEHLDFKEVKYYEELVEIIKWSEKHVFSRFFICWGAQFALNYYYSIDKVDLPEKLFGIYQYKTISDKHPFLQGFNDHYVIPESRHTQLNEAQIYKETDLEVLTSCVKLGPDIIATKDRRDLFIFGHLEYDVRTLEEEYRRDIDKGLKIAVPENYYPDDDPKQTPEMTWRSNAFILFSNWINETYQETYYDLRMLDSHPR